MINYIWFGIIFLGIIVGIMSGRADIISKALISASNDSVKIILELVGSMCLWCGVMKVAEESKIIEKVAKFIKPLLKLIFKSEGRGDKALGYIVLNITTNMLGISNAATPFGIKAMEEMQKSNPKKEIATNDMALFLVLNSACLQILPTTIISFRSACNSKNPGEIIIPAFITSLTALVIGITTCRLLQRNSS